MLPNMKYLMMISAFGGLQSSNQVDEIHLKSAKELGDLKISKKKVARFTKKSKHHR